MICHQADMVTDGFGFSLNPNQTYTILVHDPNFFLMASNPMVFPRIWATYKVCLAKLLICI